MKKFALISGTVIFIIYTLLLLQDYAGIEYHDTCLFYLGGKSLALQGFPMIDLSPALVGIIYLIGLTSIIVSVKFNNSYLIVNIVDTIYAILLLIFYSPYLSDYPPLGLEEGFVIPIFLFIELSYLSILLSIILGAYLICTNFIFKK